MSDTTAAKAFVARVLGEILGDDGLAWLPKQGTVVRARPPDETSGLATGAHHRCRLEGCNGWRISVRWPDGKRTQPCTDGMEELEDGSWRIR